MLNLPNAPNAFPVFHTSEIRPFLENNNNLFPDCALKPPEPILIDGECKFFIQKIINEHCRNKQTQYCVRWQGKGPEGDKWLPATDLKDCKALDIWLTQKKKLLKMVL
jgi:hypothetical protein